MRRLAIVVGSGAALAVLVYVGASLFLAAMRIDYSESLAVQLTKITGREVRLGNVSRLAGVLRPRIEIENLVMLAESEGNEEIARIERTVIGLDLVPLLRGVVHVDNIELYGVRLAISTDAAGELEWKPSFEATFTSESGEGMGVEIDDLDLSDVEIVYRDGVTGETTRSRLDSLRLDLEEGGRRAELVASGAVDGVEFELEGRLERITDDTLQGYVGEFEGRLEQGRIEAAGTVISPLELRGVDFRFTARLTEPLLVGGVELPPAVATGWLRDREGQLGLEDLEIEIARESNRLSVSGDVSDLIGDPKLQLELRVELQDASFLTQLIDLELPELGPIDGSALLASADGAFHLADVEVEVGAEGGPRLSAQGTVSDLTGLRDVELDVSVSAEDVRDFAPELLAERFSLGPVRGSARLTGAGDVFHLESIDLEAGAHDALWTRVTGRIDMVPGDLHLDLVARLESTRSSELERILEVDLPDLEPLRALIGIRGGSLGVDAELIEVHLGEGGDVLVNVTGEVLDLTDAARARVHFELSAPVLSAVGALFDQDLPAVGPVRASARLSTGRNRWALRGLKVEIGETIVSGSAALSNAADGRPRLSIELEAPRIHLASTPPPLLQERPPAPEERWWRQEIPLAPIRALDGDLVLRVDALTTEQERLLENLTLHLALDQGVLTVDPLSFSFEGGKLDGEARLDARSSEPSWSLRLRGKGIDLARVSSRFTDREIVSGLALASFDLSSRGTNALALLYALDGDLNFVLRQGHLSSDYALLFQKDILRALAFKGGQAETLPISCLIVDLELERGVAEFRKVLIDSKQAFVHVTGKINFRKERYDLLLTPKVKKASLFSVIVPVTVTGSLDAPVIRASRRALARDASKAVVGNILVPGAGLLAPFLRSGSRGRDPCATAVTAYVASQTAATAESP